jgi:hypothetical protein
MPRARLRSSSSIIRFRGTFKRFVARALIVAAAILGIVFAQVAPASATTQKKND